jgi:hypothetical protein
MFWYSKQSSMKTTITIPPPLTWHICQIVVDCFSPFGTTYVLNQYRGHWLLSDAFHFAISMSSKLREKPKNAPSFQTLMEEDSSVALELICLAFTITKKVCRQFSFLLEEI